jgi:hypothetical protein
MVEIFNIYAAVLFLLLVAFPVIGGAILYKAFELAKVPGFPFLKCLKIYLGGLLYFYLIVTIPMLIMKPAGGPKDVADAPVAPIVRTILLYVVPMVAIPLIARDFSRRTIAVELIAILVANTAIIFAAYLALPHILPQANPAINSAPESPGPTSIPKRHQPVKRQSVSPGSDQ